MVEARRIEADSRARLAYKLAQFFLRYASFFTQPLDILPYAHRYSNVIGENLLL